MLKSMQPVLLCVPGLPSSFHLSTSMCKYSMEVDYVDKRSDKC